MEQEDRKTGRQQGIFILSSCLPVFLFVPPV